MGENLETPLEEEEEEGKEEVVAVLQASILWHESMTSVLFPTLLKHVSKALMSPSCLLLPSLPKWSSRVQSAINIGRGQSKEVIERRAAFQQPVASPGEISSDMKRSEHKDVTFMKDNRSEKKYV